MVQVPNEIVSSLLGIAWGALLLVGKAAYNHLRDSVKEKADAERVGNLEEDVEAIGEQLDETKRLAGAAYGGVYGDAERPEDDGFIVESKREREDMKNAMADLRKEVQEVRQEQDEHNKKIEAALGTIDRKLGDD